MSEGRRSLKDRMHLAVLSERIDVAGPEVAIFRFRPVDGELFSFTAGQYATLGLDAGGEFVPRAYSIASSPYVRDHLEFYINVIKDGQLTPSIFHLHIGDHIHYMGPKGIFTLAKSQAPHLLLIATGTGLAPYVSMLRTMHAEELAGRPHGRKVTLVHGVRHTADLGYRWELDGLAREAGFGLTYVPMVSRHENDPFWTPEVGRGRVTELLKLLGDGDPATLPSSIGAEALRDGLPPGDTAAYLCGNPDMIADAKALLAERGYAEVLTEEYW